MLLFIIEVQPTIEGCLEKIIESKKKSTENLLLAYNTTLDAVKFDLAKNYQKVAKSYNYKDDYVSVNKIHTSDGNIILKPVPNNLVLVNEIRAFKIQQIDYKNRFTVFSTVHNILTKDNIVIVGKKRLLKVAFALILMVLFNKRTTITR